VPAAFKEFPPAIHTVAYQGFHRPLDSLDPRRYALEHRKVLVVDGRVGFLGGYNLGDLYATAWRDTHLRLEGPAAAHLACSFVDFWREHSAPGTSVPRRYPRVFDARIVLQDNDALRLTFPIRDLYISAIDRAERRIRLTNAYFIPDRALRHALKAAVERGVDVQVLLPWVSNHPLADWMARGLFAELLRDGIRIFGYGTMIHAKTCTIDGQWSTIGTANLDRLSSVGNYELNVEIYSSALAAQMEQLFESDKTTATELTLEVWAARPWYARASERVLAPLRVLM
jgi:cardiolipin synthase A/B